MQSNEALAIWSLVLGATLLLAIMALIVWLQMQQSRTNREQQSFLTSFVTTTLSTLSESHRQQSEALRSSAESMQERLSSQLSSGQTQLLQHLQVQTQEVMVTLASSVNQATSSVSSTASDLAKLVASSQAMIATKDPIAFQHVRGAALPFADDNQAGPYTSTEDLAYEDAQRQADIRVAEQGLAQIMKMAGVSNDEPYPVAGSGFAQAAAAAQ